MWYYQICRKRLKNGEWEYTIHETITRFGYTEDAITPCGESRKDLIKTLEWMLKDAKHYRTRTIKE